MTLLVMAYAVLGVIDHTRSLMVQRLSEILMDSFLTHRKPHRLGSGPWVSGRTTVLTLELGIEGFLASLWIDIQKFFHVF